MVMYSWTNHNLEGEGMLGQRTTNPLKLCFFPLSVFRAAPRITVRLGTGYLFWSILESAVLNGSLILTSAVFFSLVVNRDFQTAVRDQALVRLS